MACAFMDVNSITREPIWPIPDCDQIIQQIGSAHIFSQLDIKAGFHNIRLTPDSQKWTGFVTQDGLFVWKRLPFGLKGAPAHFQKVVSVTI